MKPDSSMTDGVLVVLVIVIIIATIIAFFAATANDNAGHHSNTDSTEIIAGTNLYGKSGVAVCYVS